MAPPTEDVTLMVIRAWRNVQNGDIRARVMLQRGAWDTGESEMILADSIEALCAVIRSKLIEPDRASD